jgi:hypothetical protein
LFRNVDFLGFKANLKSERDELMSARFKTGDIVGWNSEAGYVTGTIIAVHSSDFTFKGHHHRASESCPQYEIKSLRTDHVAAHKDAALIKIPESR